MSHRNQKFYKVILLGDSGVGKTSIIRRFVHDTWSPSYKSTIGADCCTKHVLLDNQAVLLQIWDTAGQERYKALTAAYYRGADCCVLTFDTTNADSFENLERWREDFLMYLDPPDPENFPFVLLANKVDVPDRMVSEKVADQWCRKNNIPYIEISAKYGFNVQWAFESVARRALEREKKVQLESTTALHITMPTRERKRGCCRTT